MSRKTAIQLSSARPQTQVTCACCFLPKDPNVELGRKGWSSESSSGWASEILHQLMVYAIVQRVSTVLLVMQGFATIHSIVMLYYDVLYPTGMFRIVITIVGGINHRQMVGYFCVYHIGILVMAF